MQQLVDMDGAISELGLEKADMKMLVAELRIYLRTNTPKLKYAIERADVDSIKANAHSLKGALLNLRFKAAAEIALEIEQHSSEYTIERGLAAYNRLSDLLTDSFYEVDQYFG